MAKVGVRTAIARSIFSPTENGPVNEGVGIRSPNASTKCFFARALICAANMPSSYNDNYRI